MKTLLYAALGCSLLAPTATDLLDTQHPGETRTTTFRLEEELQLTEFELSMNGEEKNVPEMSQERSSKRRATFVDHYQTVANGRATTFERRYIDLADTGEFSMTDPVGEERGQSRAGASDLEGKSVQFSAADGEYEAAFSEGQAGDAKALAGLAARLPWASLLPEGPVEGGDEWVLEPALLDSLLVPGGDLAFEDADAEWPPLSVREPLVPEGADYEGELRARLAAIETKDGTTLARIELEVDVTVYQDLTDFVADTEELPEDAPPDTFTSRTDTVEQDTAYSGGGLLLWNVTEGRLESLELELELHERQQVVAVMGEGEGATELDQVMVHEGRLVLEVEVASRIE